MQTYSPDGVRLERTGWRCQDISDRHRTWGFDCPAVDLDFVMAEYNHGLPVALVEYKHRQARAPNLDHATYRALAALANGYSDGPLPFFVTFYDPVRWWFRVVPVNDPARLHYGDRANIPLSEERYVRSLYALRKAVLTAADENLIGLLSTFVP